MKRWDEIKLRFTRGWQFPGKARLAHQLINVSNNRDGTFFEGISWFEQDDICIYTNTKSYVEWKLFSTGSYENELRKLFAISLKPGDVALDIGANVGIQALRMSRLVGETGRIIACEPVEHLRKCLQKNIALNRSNNIQVVSYAISDFDGVTEIKINTSNWNQGTAALVSEGEKGTTVHVMTGDTLYNNYKLNRVDLIKIDVEGFEFQVLKGLKQVLINHKPRIIFEYDKAYWSRTACRFTECFEYLKGLNYTLYSVFESGAELIVNPDNVSASNVFCLIES